MAGVMAGVATAALAGIVWSQSAAPAGRHAIFLPALDRRLPGSIEPVMKSLERRFDARRAMDVVTFMDRFWRLAGNPGYEASQELIRDRLAEAGFKADTGAGGTSGARLWFAEFPNRGAGWEMVDYRLAMVASGSAGDELVLSRERDHIALCINSYSTPEGGLLAPLVYVGGGKASDYEGLDVRGAVVLGDGASRALWTEAVRNRGALGVISAAPPPGYTRPAETPDVFQWGSVPNDEAARAFGFKAHRQAADRLKERLKAGPVRVKVEIATRFHQRPNRSLIAEIPGAGAPAERVVLVAHVQEPGANDNASGCATLVEIARALQSAVAAGEMPPPARTITFIWGDEITMSQQWLRADAARAAAVRYAFSLDMTGEDTSKTGGTFLIEKMPDPSAVWTRPSDPHTEWGFSPVRAEALKGNLLNDLHLAVCLRRARDTGWVVRTNPYEGGSDHSAFGAAGIPSILDWHFPDRYYHTNLDRPDKTSPAEMKHVGVAVGATAMLLATASSRDATAVVDLLAAAADTRLNLELAQSATIVGTAPDAAAAETTERAVFAAWQKWYGEALESVRVLPVAGADAALEAKIREARARVSSRPWRITKR